MRFYNRENEIAEHIRTKILSGYDIESRLYTIDDM